MYCYGSVIVLEYDFSVLLWECDCHVLLSECDRILRIAIGV